MPTYTYQCTVCKKPYSEILSISDYTGVGPLCCDLSMKRTYEFQNPEGPEVIFKGSGWPSQDIKRERGRR